MPQLDVSTFPPQLAWLALTFIVLYVLMTWPVLPRIRRVLEVRKDKIDGTLARAQTLKAEAEAARDGYEKAVAEARSRGHGQVTAAIERAKAEANARLESQAEVLAGRARESDDAIARAKRRALGGINDAAAEIARSAAEKLLGTPVETGKAEAAVAAVRGESR
jgi:F-type H+-transporting ATPase subunit b